MRLVSPLGRLSRGIAGICGQSIICNTPGSPKGCVEQLARDPRRPPARPAPAQRITNHRTDQPTGADSLLRCSGWCCPRVRWRRPRSSCSRRPTCRSCVRRRSTTRPPSTTRGSPMSASCARRRSRRTWPRACSTSASPGATGWRRPSSDVVSLGELRYSQGHLEPGAWWSCRRRRLARAIASRTCPRACASPVSTRS